MNAPAHPRAFRDQQLVRARFERLREPHVAPLNAWVEHLRVLRGGGESVPWFDPDGGGIQAEALLLLEAPGPRAVGVGSPRPNAGGSGIISPDNNDQTASNTFRLRDEAGLDRRRIVHWNAVPWYIGDGTRIRAANQKDLLEGTPFLVELVKMLPRLRAVVLVGKAAQRAWSLVPHSEVRPGIEILSCPHPSPTNLNINVSARAEILRCLVAVRDLLENPASRGI